MIRLAKSTTTVLAFWILLAGNAQADFGLKAFDVQIAAGPPADLTETVATTAGGQFTQAGGHPYAIVTHIEWNSHLESDPNVEEGAAFQTPDGDIKSTLVDLPPGMVGNPNAIPQCTVKQLAGQDVGLADPAECPSDSQVGVIHLDLNTSETTFKNSSTTYPVYNMVPPAGAPARFGFDVGKNLIYLDAEVRQDGTYGITVGPRNAPQALRIVGSDVTFWGIPADERHFVQRCTTLYMGLPGDRTHAECEAGAQSDGVDMGPQEAHAPRVPFLTMPTSCTALGEGTEWKIRSDSWENPGVFSAASVRTHLPPYAPDVAAPGPEAGVDGCAKVPFDPDLTVSPSQQSAASPTGLAITLRFPSDGLLNPDGIAQSHLKKAVVALPQGMTINPSQAEGLGVCAPQQYEQVSVGNDGCPSTSKIGTVEVKTPLIAETIPGTVYVAKPYDNPFNSLLALYVVLREPQRGIAVRLAGKVQPDPSTGQLVATFDELPQLPVETFELRLREGARAPLVTPQACGTYETQADFYPWARPDDPVPSTTTFEVTSGVGGGPCPGDGLPPFKPGLIAGSINNNAGSYSPFDVRLFRTDEEQEITHFSIKLPPGVLGKLAGIPSCSEAQIAAAEAREGRPDGGQEELEAPSCPAASEVGRTLVGAGVGSVQTYAPGNIYLAGPYNGSQLSIAAITAAKVGPFDLGTVVVRQALRIDPETAEAFIDATGSDPIPHIIDGITTHIRDIRAYVDRPDFMLNPTSCDPTSTASTVLGSGLDFASAHDDEPVVVSTRYQAANCANLAFRPRLNLRLLGGTKRGANPEFRAVLRMRSEGESNIARAQVTLPRSAFLDQSHIRTVCTRVQYKADQCPANSIYGYARAITPLLDEPLEGPVFLRSSEHKLPDLVAGLKNGKIEIDLVGRIDSFRGGRIRNTFETVPDAPVTKFTLIMQGGAKGLITNSTDLCKGKHRAIVAFDAHNGKIRDSRPAVGAQCGKRRKSKRAGKRADR